MQKRSSSEVQKEKHEFKNANSNSGKFVKLSKLDKKIAVPMLFLSFVWLCILIMELVNGTNPTLSDFGTMLWIIFVLYFLLRLRIASSPKALLKKDWLFILAILVSVLRFFPTLQPLLFVRGLTFTFGMQLIWIFVSADQGIRFVRRALGKRGAGYVIVLTAVVIFTGAAGILHFESLSEDVARIQSYPNAVWWTAMQMTNIGSTYSIKTAGGKIICLAVSIYSAGMFGYLTALFAALIIDRDIKVPKVEVSNQKQLQDIQEEIIKLRKLIEETAKSSQSNST